MYNCYLTQMPSIYNTMPYDITEHMKNYYKSLRGDNNMIMNEEEGQDFISKQLENIIKDNNIEVDKKDDNYVYLYLPTDINGNLSNSIHCTVDKTIASNDGMCVGSLNDVKERQKGSIAHWIDYSKSHVNNYLLPINPSILKEQTFKIFKVRIHKNNIKRLEKDYNDNITFYVTEMEIVEEVQLENKITYKIQNIKDNERHKGFVDFIFKITNETTGRDINVDFTSDKIDLSQEEIQTKIKERLDTMQAVYDEYQVSYGELDL